MRWSILGTVFCLAWSGQPPAAMAASTPYIAPPVYTVPGMMYPQLYNVCPGGTCSKGGSGPAQGTGQGAPATTAFVPDPAVRQRVKAAFVADLSQKQPAKAQEYARLFQSRDMIADFDRRYASLGLHSNDAADAYAAFWLQCWQAANHVAAPVGPAAARAVRAQVGATMQKSAAPAMPTPASRETFAETLIYRTVLLGDATAEASRTGQTAALQQLGDQAARALPGMDQRQLALTDAGFRKR
jgi:hypothetical protein